MVDFRTALNGTLPSLPEGTPDFIVGADSTKVSVPSFLGAVTLTGRGPLADDTQRVRAAQILAASLGVGLIIRGSVRLTGTAISYNGSPVYIDARDAEIIQDGDFIPFDIDLPFTADQGIGSITTESVDLSGGTASSTLVSRLNGLSDTSSYNVGDWVKVYSDDIQPGTNPSDNERLAEFALVSAKTENTVTFYSALEESYVTNPRVCRMNADRVHILAPTFSLASPAETWWNERCIQINGAIRPAVIASRAKSGASAFVEYVSCLFPYSEYVSGSNLRTSSADNAQGYVIAEYSCWGGFHLNPSGSNVRNVYTTGCKSSSPGDNQPKNRGRTQYSRVLNPISLNSQGSTWSTHAGACFCTVYNPVGISPFNGPSNAARAVVVKGRNNRVLNLQTNGNGVAVLQDYDDPLNCGDHTIEGMEWNGRGLAGSYALQVLNVAPGATNKVKDIKLIFPKIRNTAGFSPTFNIRGGEVEVINPDIKWKASGSTTARYLDADDGSKVLIRNPRIDYTGSTATSIRDINVLDASSSVEVENPIIIPGGSNYQGLGDMKSANGSLTIRKANLIGQAPSLASGVYNIGAPDNVSIDYVIDSGRTSNRNRITGSSVSSSVINSTITLDLSNRGGEEIFAEVNPTATGISVAGSASTAKGKYILQRLTLTNVGTQPFTLKNDTAARINLGGSDKTINVGSAISLVWTGDTSTTGWKPAS